MSLFLDIPRALLTPIEAAAKAAHVQPKYDILMVNVTTATHIEPVFQKKTEKEQQQKPWVLDGMPTPTPILFDRLKKRERQALERVHEKVAQRGQGVTSQAQAVFDALAKTYRCSFDALYTNVNAIAA